MEEYEDEFEAEGLQEDDYEMEEPLKPSEEELQYLEFRQHLKEKFRNKVKKDSTSSYSGFQENGKKLPYDNFGSFFGPSQSFIAQRVIQESKSLFETRHLTSKMNSHQSTRMTNPSTTISPNNRVHECNPKPNELKMKVQNIKEARDYSFLFSDEELPGPPKEPQSQNINMNSAAKSSQPSLKGTQSLKTSMDKPLLGNPKLKKPAPVNLIEPHNITAAKKLNPIPARKHDPVPVNSRKMVQNTENGRSLASNNMPSKVSASKLEKRPAMTTARNPNQSKTHTNIPKQHFQPKQTQVSKISNGAHKLPFNSSKPLVNRSSSNSIPIHKRKPSGQYSDDSDDEDEDVRAFNMMRKMTRYNPNKFAKIDDEDDSDMEAGFDDIMMEERRSDKLGRMEDAEELRKIEAEEERERLRKLQKKRKLGHK